jgi:hypothetical protein
VGQAPRPQLWILRNDDGHWKSVGDVVAIAAGLHVNSIFDE